MAKTDTKDTSVRKLRQEARAMVKSQIAIAEQRGYKRGLNSALSILRKKQ